MEAWPEFRRAGWVASVALNASTAALALLFPVVVPATDAPSIAWNALGASILACFAANLAGAATNWKTAGRLTGQYPGVARALSTQAAVKACVLVWAGLGGLAGGLLNIFSWGGTPARLASRIVTALSVAVPCSVGATTDLLALRERTRPPTPGPEPPARPTLRSWTKRSLALSCYLAAALAPWPAFSVPFGWTDVATGLVSIVAGQFGGFLALVYAGAAALLWGLNRGGKRRLAVAVPVGTCVVAACSFSLPLVATPFAIASAQAEFEGAFGREFAEAFPEGAAPGFRTTPFLLPSYFLGQRDWECGVDRDVVYYSNNGVTLRFDAYYPLTDLTSNRTTIITIHGGGWTAGDKGVGNVAAVNEYLAHQGHVVFDVQYGLIEGRAEFVIPTPDDVKGNFTVVDQVEQLGAFTKVLASNLSRVYGCDVGRTVILGRSAGAHLAGVVGLGYNDPFFEGTFDPRLTVKGVVMLYPPDDLSEFSGALPFPRLVDVDLLDHYAPSKLVDPDDPLVLLFHGTSDGIVPARHSRRVEEAADRAGVKCARLVFPFAGHAGDALFYSNYGQMWLYYLERFLYVVTNP
ncbi:MAG: hypothetical protein Kow0069_18540 [Promethearchaeota archaeon]